MSRKVHFVEEANVSAKTDGTLVHVAHEAIARAQLERANAAIDKLIACGGNAPPAETDVFSDSVWLREPYWKDLIDPELCLFETVRSGQPTSAFRWQPADAEVSDDYRVFWRSWVNHLDSTYHSSVLNVLAELLGTALPAAEAAVGRSFRNRMLQVVVRAYEQVIEGADSAIPSLVRISDWHVDGTPEDNILVTAACYLGTEGIMGGEVEFQRRWDLFTDDPGPTGLSKIDNRVAPKTGSIVAFNNEALRHKVHNISGPGRRRLVAFHIVDPDVSPRSPRACEIPRQLAWQRRRDGLEALFQALGNILPLGLLEYIWDNFISDGATPASLIATRNLERSWRLSRSRVRTLTGIVGWNSSTGSSFPSDLD